MTTFTAKIALKMELTNAAMKAAAMLMRTKGFRMMTALYKVAIVKKAATQAQAKRALA